MTTPQPKRGRPPKYPWAKWTDGELHTAVPGVDFTVSTKAIQEAIYYHAHANGLQVKTQMAFDGSGLMFRFVKKGRKRKGE